jgi:glyoxylase-like metal-dependent hydrolase (beta-lactamase superfamily II)
MKTHSFCIETLAQGVHLLCGDTGGRPLQLPLLVGSTGALLIDTGNASDVQDLILPAMAKLGVAPARLTHILITHCDHDHIGGNHEMKQLAPQAFLGCGAEDKAQVESPETIWNQRYDAYRAKHHHFYPDGAKAAVLGCLGKAQKMDGVFTGGDRITLAPDWEVEVVHLPGHSHGHLGVFDRKHGILFGGDAIQGNVYLNQQGEPALCPTYLYPQAYLRTIEKIRALNPDAYVGCHWPVQRGAQVGAFCDESRDFVLKAEALILAELKTSPGGLTLSELCGRCGPALGSWPANIHHELCYAFSGHLDDLETRGIIRAAEGVPARFTLS